MVNAGANVAIDALDVLMAFATALCFILLFFHAKHILFSARTFLALISQDFVLHGYFTAGAVFYTLIRRFFMALYAIADLHLSTLDETNKSMEVFGPRWASYMDRLVINWKKLVTDEDTVIVPGDISWALSLDEATSDLKLLDSLPGKKILGKGNHDFWWCTMKKHEAMFEKNGITTISFLFNNAYETEDYIIAGTRGWYHDPDAKNAPDNADFAKLVNREAGRLRMSLNKAKELKEKSPEKEIIVFMHFPPFWNGKESEPMMNLLIQYGVKRLYYGHIHGNYTVPPEFVYKDVQMSIVSADYLNFIPKIIL